MYCHAGCDIKDVVHASGLEMKDLFTPDGNGKMEIVATYDYADENGVLIYQVVRYSNKTFRQRKALDNGEWEWNLKGVKRVPYRLPSIIKNANKRIIIIVEGEKDVHTLLEAGARCVTTNSGGAGKWIADYNQFFKGANVVAIPDNDSPGLDHMYNVCNNLFDHAKSVRLVKLTGLKDKQDVSDWLKDHSLEELLDITEKTPVRTFTPMPNPKQKFEIEENSIKHFHLTDTGNANRLVKLFGQKIRYCKTPMKKWFIWSDSCWKIDTTDMIYEFADLTVRSLYKEAANIEDKEEREKLDDERKKYQRTQKFLASSRKEKQGNLEQTHKKCRRGAMIFAWILTSLVSLLLLAGFYVAWPTEPASVMSIGLALLLAFLTLFTVGNLFLGTTVKLFHKCLQDWCYTWLFKREGAAIKAHLSELDNIIG